MSNVPYSGPLIASISPTQAPVGSGDTVVTIQGQNLAPTFVTTGSTTAEYDFTVSVNGTPVATTNFGKANPAYLTCVVPASLMTVARALQITATKVAPAPVGTVSTQAFAFEVFGGSAGVVAVGGDGTYTATPAVGPFGQPGQATSLAQALFEQKYPVIISTMNPSQLAEVVDLTTSPPTTQKGKVLQTVALHCNGDAAAIVGALAAPVFEASILTDGLATTNVPETLVARAVRPCSISAFVLANENNNVSADPSNCVAIVVSKRTAAGGGPTTVATLSSATASWGPWSSTAIPLSGGNVTLAPGDTLTFQAAKTGTGALLGPVLVQALSI